MKIYFQDTNGISPQFLFNYKEEAFIIQKTLIIYLLATIKSTILKNNLLVIFFLSFCIDFVCSLSVFTSKVIS